MCTWYMYVYVYDLFCGACFCFCGRALLLYLLDSFLLLFRFIDFAVSVIAFCRVSFLSLPLSACMWFLSLFT